MIQRFADRENDVTYKTQFQGNFKGVCNRNLRKIVLNSVIINTLHVGIYMIELFYKAAITSSCSSSCFPCVGGEASLLVTAKYGYFRD